MNFGLTAVLASAMSLSPILPAAAVEPETVYFASADSRTEIVGYLFEPQSGGRHAAIVMLHGRRGPYSTNDNKECTFVSRSASSACNAGTLSKRHVMWGEYWAERGYLALLPDSFGPRGKAHGFGRFTHNDPDRDDVNERTVRPLDAEGALSYLRGRTDVIADRIFLQGWSNGGSTALNVMIRQGAATAGFRAALAFYPGCGKLALIEAAIFAKAPITMFLGSKDEEVSPTICEQVAVRSREVGSTIELILYEGATHDFDNPGHKRQSVPENKEAKADAMARAIAVVEGLKD